LVVRCSNSLIERGVHVTLARGLHTGHRRLSANILRIVCMY
jgi:hypothetical protein